jgi:hypothetical protein
MMEKNSTLTTPYLNCESIGPWKKMEQSLQKKIWTERPILAINIGAIFFGRIGPD